MTEKAAEAGFKDEERHIETVPGEIESSDGKDNSALATVENGAANPTIDLTPEEQRAILKKVDYRLVPLLAFLYLVAFVDRSNSTSFISSFSKVKAGNCVRTESSARCS